MNLESDLLGFWKLDGDYQDTSGQENHGARIEADPSKVFILPSKERAYHIEVPPKPSLNLGTRNFSISAWVKTSEVVNDTLGDIVNQYDPQKRKGWNLYLQNFQGTPSSYSNCRNLFFGIDDGTEPAWSDCGRPGNNRMVWALAVYKGDLYAGTFEMEKEGAGHVYRYGGNSDWIDCGSPHPCNAVTSLSVFEGNLYAAVGHYRSSGSAIGDSPNEIPGGKVFRYLGDKNWVEVGNLPIPEAIFGLAVYRGQLYASSMYAPPGVYRYEGGNDWNFCGHSGGRVVALTAFRENLYGTGYDVNFGGVYRYDGNTTWADCGTSLNTTQTYSFAVHAGNLHVGTWPGGTAFRYAGGHLWSGCGRLGEELEVMGLMMYNGKMYAGTLPLAQVYRYDGNLKWTCTGQLDKTPDVKYRRVWSMAVYRGSLFCGTLPSGHVYRLETGKCISHDDELKSGWRHLIAIRDNGILKVFVDREQVAQSAQFSSNGFDLGNEQPLRIGFGPHDYFNGIIRNVRLYGRVLTGEEIATLSHEAAPNG